MAVSQITYETALRDMMRSVEELFDNEERPIVTYWGHRYCFPIFVGAIDLRSGGRRRNNEVKAMLVIGGILVLAAGAIALLATLFESRIISYELDKWREYTKIITKENTEKYAPGKDWQKLKVILDESKSIFKGRKAEAQVNVALCLGIIMAAGLIIIGACALPAGIGIALVVAGTGIVAAITILKIAQSIFKPAFSNSQLQRIYDAAGIKRTIIVIIHNYERMNFWTRVRYGNYF